MADQYSYIAITQFIATWLMMPLWMYVMARLGKHRSWCWSAIIGSAATLLLVSMNPTADSMTLIFILFAMIGGGWAANMIAPYSIMADIVDYDELKSGVNQATNYFAVFSFLTKACVATGSGIAFILLGLAGFQVDGDNSPSERNAFLMVMFLIPLLASALMVIVTWRFPLDRTRATVIRRRLDKRQRTPG